MEGNGKPRGLHVAIIMDGNGRWALSRGLARSEGHRAGAVAVDRVVRSARDSGIRTLTLFALSSDNWRRPPEEIETILAVLGEFLGTSVDDLSSEGVQISVIGRRDRLPAELISVVERAEKTSAAGSRLHVRLAVDYSSRDEIVGAARRFHVHHAANGARDGFGRLLARDDGAGDVDLLIRTGGEMRLSDFLLWECAYAELVFSRRMWPEFDAESLNEAIAEYRSRERRFGCVSRPDLC